MSDSRAGPSRLYPCRWDFCERTFTSISGLNRHFDEDHLPYEKPQVILAKKRKIATGVWQIIGPEPTIEETFPLRHPGDVTTTTEGTTLTQPYPPSLPSQTLPPPSSAIDPNYEQLSQPSPREIRSNLEYGRPAVRFEAEAAIDFEHVSLTSPAKESDFGYPSKSPITSETSRSQRFSRSSPRTNDGGPSKSPKSNRRAYLPDSWQEFLNVSPSPPLTTQSSSPYVPITQAMPSQTKPSNSVRSAKRPDNAGFQVEGSVKEKGKDKAKQHASTDWTSPTSMSQRQKSKLPSPLTPHYENLLVSQLSIRSSQSVKPSDQHHSHHSSPLASTNSEHSSQIPSSFPSSGKSSVGMTSSGQRRTSDLVSHTSPGFTSRRQMQQLSQSLESSQPKTSSGTSPVKSYPSQDPSLPSSIDYSSSSFTRSNGLQKSPTTSNQHSRTMSTSSQPSTRIQFGVNPSPEKQIEHRGDPKHFQLNSATDSRLTHSATMMSSRGSSNQVGFVWGMSR